MIYCNNCYLYRILTRISSSMLGVDSTTRYSVGTSSCTGDACGDVLAFPPLWEDDVHDVVDGVVVSLSQSQTRHQSRVTRTGPALRHQTGSLQSPGLPLQQTHVPTMDLRLVRLVRSHCLPGKIYSSWSSPFYASVQHRHSRLTSEVHRSAPSTNS